MKQDAYLFTQCIGIIGPTCAAYTCSRVSHPAQWRHCVYSSPGAICLVYAKRPVHGIKRHAYHQEKKTETGLQVPVRRVLKICERIAQCAETTRFQ